ncbi:hypothetical protein CRYUN_Cryun18bG0027800 [Craigia yunnanensis]
MRLKHQINKPSLADIFSPSGGRITTVDNYNLSILQFLQLNGKKGVLYRVEEGQIIVVPQNFAVLKKACNQGLEWIAFKSNANAKINQIVGRVSAFRAMPLDVLVNSYDISREEVRRLKESRQEMSVLAPFLGHSIKGITLQGGYNMQFDVV